MQYLCSIHELIKVLSFLDVQLLVTAADPFRASLYNWCPTKENTAFHAMPDLPSPMLVLVIVLERQEK